MTYAAEFDSLPGMRLITGCSVLAVFGTFCAAADIDDEPSWEHEKLRSAAAFAAAKGNLPLLEELLKGGLEVNKPVDIESGQTALHQAVQSEQPEAIRFLLKHGASPFLRDKWGNRPIDGLSGSRVKDIPSLLEALKKPQDDYDRTEIAGIPLPVWLEILGEVTLPPDPLSRKDKTGEQDDLPLFISINGSDPVKELHAALDARYPGWKPGNEAEEVDKGRSYRDKASQKPIELLQITVQPAKSTQIESKTLEKSPLALYCKAHELPAFEYKVRRTRGFLAGGGWGGHLVLMAGYWIQVGGYGFDE